VFAPCNYACLVHHAVKLSEAAEKHSLPEINSNTVIERGVYHFAFLLIKASSGLSRQSQLATVDRKTPL
jgi:hypothetical protein